MDINVNIKVDEEQVMNPQKKDVASGWVEIENCLKFPVKVRKYITDEGEEKMFVTYPQRKNGEKYEGIVYPHDKEVRKEIEEKVLREVGAMVVKGISLPTVESVRVSLVKQKRVSSVSLCGLATIKIAGMTINGISIKEGQNGLFVQMPQYKSGGEYRDTVYGTNKEIHTLIKNKVLEAYHELMEQREKTEQKLDTEMAINGLIQAFQEKSTEKIMDIIKESEQKIEVAKFTKNGNVVSLQAAVMYDEDRMADVSFHNYWNPLQQTPPTEPLEQKIVARIWEDGNIKGVVSLVERKSNNLKNAEKNYNEVLSIWKNLTGQEKIEIPREQQKEQWKQNVRAEKQVVPGI